MKKIIAGIGISLFIAGILGTLIFFFLWQNTTNELENTQKLLKDAEETIVVLKQDKDKLIEYSRRKDDELKLIEQKYAVRINAIPKDQCGDAKPSPELLQFLKERK